MSVMSRGRYVLMGYVYEKGVFRRAKSKEAYVQAILKWDYVQGLMFMRDYSKENKMLCSLRCPEGLCLCVV